MNVYLMMINATVIKANMSSNNTSLQNDSSTFGDCGNQVATHGCDIYTFIISCIVSGLLCILGLLGNIVAFCVFRYDKMKTSTSFLFQGLAFIDSMLLLASFPLYSMLSLHEYTGYMTWFPDVHVFLLVYVYPIAMTAQTATIWVTVLVGFNRFVAVCKPYKAPRLCTVNQARKQLACVIVLSILYNVPRFFDSKIMRETHEDGNVTIYPDHTALGKNKHYMTIYVNICYMIFLLILPLLILTTLNLRLMRALKELKRKRQEMQSLRQQQDNNVTFVLIIVVIVFTVCQFPALITQISWNVLDDCQRQCGGFQFYFSKISNMLVIINSSVNFVIYFLFNTRFRQVLMQACCRQEYQKVRTGQSTMMTTHTNHHNHNATATTGTSIKRCANDDNVANNATEAENANTETKCENGDGVASEKNCLV